MSNSPVGDERRTNAQLRAIFPAACEALRPFFETSSSWSGQSQDHLAYQELRERFAGLSSQDAFIVVNTVKRLLASGKFAPTDQRQI